MSDSRAWDVTKTVVFASLFLGFLMFWLPARLGILDFHTDFHGLRALRLLALFPLIAGAIIGLGCAFDFAWTGRGTPAPFDPPRLLVVRGLYAYVRNPMYVGAGLAMLSLWGMIGVVCWAALVYAAVILCAVNLFVLFYEEPALRSKFGEEYQQYCRYVPRWLPRLTPWSQERAKTAIPGR